MSKPKLSPLEERVLRFLYDHKDDEEEVSVAFAAKEMDLHHSEVRAALRVLAKHGFVQRVSDQPSNLQSRS